MRAKAEDRKLEGGILAVDTRFFSPRARPSSVFGARRAMTWGDVAVCEGDGDGG